MGPILVEHPDGPGRCSRIALGAETFGNQIRSLPIGSLRGRRVRLTARLKVERAGRVQPWLRFDHADGTSWLADNMHDRPVLAGSGWTEVEIVANLERKPGQLVIGTMTFDGADALFDWIKLEDVGPSAPGAPDGMPEPPRPLKGRALDNLRAFARLFGYVRYFHPSDQSAAWQHEDWASFAIDCVRTLESAATPMEAAAELQRLFGPIASSVDVWAAGTDRSPRGARQAGAGRAPTHASRWCHRGVGLGGPSTYSSVRETAALAAPDAPDWTRELAEPILRDLGGGVLAVVPHVLPSNGESTLPLAPAATRPVPRWRVTGKLSADTTAADRASRLATVLIAWNVLQHFYPYHDVVEVDWLGTLDEALSAAAEDDGVEAFDLTLERLVAALEDGHGSVRRGGGPARGRLPFTLDWAGDELVVTAVHESAADRIAVGDSIAEIDARPALEHVHQLESRISGATEAARRRSALWLIVTCRYGNEIELTVDRGHAQERLSFTMETVTPWPMPPKRPVADEVEPGIWTVDLTRITTAEFQELLPRLVGAEGIVFDMRGYPGAIDSQTLFGGLILDEVESPIWNIPVTHRPDREAIEWKTSRWTIHPAADYLRARRVFLTGAEAGSYAETCMGIVEAYGLGEILGAATAGTNGNINWIPLPCGYTVVFTGMKVQKHDGSRHHGVGIQPGVPVARTRAGIREGRDEVMEAGIRALTG